MDAMTEMMQGVPTAMMESIQEASAALDRSRITDADREKVLQLLADMEKPDAMKRELMHAIGAAERALARADSPALKDYLKAQIRDFRAEISAMESKRQ